jgi:hypothetical protein
MALTLLQDQSACTVPLALQSFQTQFSSSYGQLNAFIVMSILPVLIYLMFQRFFTSGALSWPSRAPSRGSRAGRSRTTRFPVLGPRGLRRH